MMAHKNECECTIEEQTGEHILTRCALAEEARQEARTRVGRDLDMATLLYTQEAMQETVAIWKEFAKTQREIMGRQGEGEEGERDLEWGWGELER